VIAEHLLSIPVLSGRYTILPRDEITAKFQELHLLLADLNSRHDVEVRRLDATDLDYSDMGEGIASQGVGNQSVTVYLAYNREAALMTCADNSGVTP
jgi:hypothetical protein